MRVLIVRHGSAVSGYEAPEPQRYLTADGRAALRRVAAKMAELDLVPTRMFVSPLVRAVQTAEILAAGTGYAGAIASHAPLVPGGPTAGALSVLEDCEDSDVVALVSHEPTVRSLAAHLTGLGGFPGFYTGGVAVIRLSAGANRGAFEGRLDPSTLSWRGPEDLAP